MKKLFWYLESWEYFYWGCYYACGICFAFEAN